MAALILSPHSDNLAKQLYWASWNGPDREVLKLLQRGAPPNSDYYTREQHGYTPLHMACVDKYLRSAELLIKFGAIVTATTKYLCSAELLIKFGAIVAATTNNGWTPLHWACAYNSKATAKLLLEHHCPTGEPRC